MKSNQIKTSGLVFVRGSWQRALPALGIFPSDKSVFCVLMPGLQLGWNVCAGLRSVRMGAGGQKARAPIGGLELSGWRKGEGLEID